MTEPTMIRLQPARMSPASPPKKKLVHALPSSRLRFESQLKVLKAWAVAGRAKAVPSNDDVADICGVAGTTVSGNNAFFLEAGLLVKEGGGYRPSPVTAEFGRADSFGSPEATKKLGLAFREAWFWKALEPHLEFAPLTRDDAILRLAEAADASDEHRPQLNSLLEWLAAADLISEDDDRISRVQLAKSQVAATSPDAQSAAAPPSVLVTDADTYTVTLGSGGEVALTVSVNLFTLSSSDRDFVLELIDTVRGYETRVYKQTAEAIRTLTADTLAAQDADEEGDQES